jgi:hypothetical protein
LGTREGVARKRESGTPASGKAPCTGPPPRSGNISTGLPPPRTTFLPPFFSSQRNTALFATAGTPFPSLRASGARIRSFSLPAPSYARPRSPQLRFMRLFDRPRPPPNLSRQTICNTHPICRPASHWPRYEPSPAEYALSLPRCRTTAD